MHTLMLGFMCCCRAATVELSKPPHQLTACGTFSWHGLFIALLMLSCRGIWRNSLLFSPTVKYGDYSYADVMTAPLAEAMRDALAAAAKVGKLVTPPDRSRPVVYMALQGDPAKPSCKTQLECSAMMALGLLTSMVLAWHVLHLVAASMGILGGFLHWTAGLAAHVSSAHMVCTS